MVDKGTGTLLRRGRFNPAVRIGWQLLGNRTLGDDAYNALKKQILTGHLSPGDRLMYDQLTNELVSVNRL